MAHWLELTLDDADDRHEVNAAQVLGDRSPLVFEDGYAAVDDDEAAEELARRYTAIERTPPPEDADEDEDEDEDEGEGEADAVEELLEGTVDEIEAALETGDWDDQLDEIADRDDRQGVSEAVDDRRESGE